MSITLSAKEHEMLAAVLQEMKELPSVDFNRVAAKTGQKYARNARSSFKRVWDKLKQGNNENDDDGEDAQPKTKTAKATTKKTVGKITTPRKASSGGPKNHKKSKTNGKRDSEHGDDSSDEDLKEESQSPNNSNPANESFKDEYEQEVRDAKFMGISVEEWRDLARRAPTPQGQYSDGEE